MITQLQKARDERRLTSNNSMAFEFIIAGIGCFVFSLITLFLLPNNTPLLITSQILFFGVIILIMNHYIMPGREKTPVFRSGMNPPHINPITETFIK